MAGVVTRDAQGNLIVGNKPSILDTVALIGYQKNPIMTMIGKSKAAATVHGWITDELGDPVNQNYVEIAPFSEAEGNTKQKTTNEVEIFQTTASVSWDQEATANYGEKEYAWKKRKALIQHGQKIEYRLLGLGRNANAKTSVFMEPLRREANSGAGKMAGIFYYTARNATGFTAGARGNVKAYDSAADWTGTPTAITLNRMDELAEIIWNAGGEPRDAFVGGDLMRSIMGLVDRQLGNEKVYNYSVNTITLATCTLRLHLHPYLTPKFGLGGTIIMGDFSYAKVANLAEKNMEVPETKTAKEHLFYNSCTLEMRNAANFAIGVGLA